MEDKNLWRGMKRIDIRIDIRMTITCKTAPNSTRESELLVASGEREVRKKDAKKKA